MPNVLRITIVLATIFAFAFSGAASIGTPEFTVSSTIWSTQTFSHSVVSGDFNRDGIPDMAVTNFIAGSGATVSIFLGNGDGSFQSPSSYPAGVEVIASAIADLNGDGILDLLITDVVGTVNVLLGNGDGSFQASVSYSCGPNPNSIVISDFNGDGVSDVAVSNGITPGAMSVLLGKGDGSLQPATTFNAPGLAASIAAGDVNGDSVPDIAIGLGGPRQVAVFIGNGDGTFEAPTTQNVTAYVTWVSVSDFNNDGKADLLVTEGDPKTLQGFAEVLTGNGDGTFQRRSLLLGSLTAMTAGALGDFNGDGLPDLVALAAPPSSSGTAGTASILFGNGNGTVVAPQSYTVGLTPVAAVVGDLTSDGYSDVIVLNEGNSGFSSASILHNAGSTIPVTLSNLVLSFSTAPGTTSAPQAVKLTNTSEVALNISAVSVSGSFLLKNGCGASIAPNASCNLTVQFRPKKLGLSLGSLSITDSAPKSPQKIQLSGTTD